MNIGGDGAELNEQRKARLLQERARLRTLFQTVFGTPEGQQALTEIVKVSGALSFKEMDAEHTQLAEGGRRLAIWIASFALGDNVEEKLLEKLKL